MNSELFKLPPLPVPVLFDASVRLLGLAIALGAILLASRWLTELTAPRPVARLPSVGLALPETGPSTIGQMFGVNETHPQAIEGLSLTGVFVGSRGGGFATFRTPKGAVSVFPGDEVVPGVKLKQIERDRVILLSADAKKELPLSTQPIAAESAPPAAPLQAVAAQDTPAQVGNVPDPAVGIANSIRRGFRNRNRPGDEE